MNGKKFSKIFLTRADGKLHVYLISEYKILGNFKDDVKIEESIQFLYTLIVPCLTDYIILNEERYMVIFRVSGV